MGTLELHPRRFRGLYPPLRNYCYKSGSRCAVFDRVPPAEAERANRKLRASETVRGTEPCHNGAESRPAEAKRASRKLRVSGRVRGAELSFLYLEGAPYGE